MAHPEIAFSLRDGERQVLKLSHAQGDMIDARLDRLDAIMGNDFAANAIPLKQTETGFSCPALPACQRLIGGTRPTSTFL